MQTKLSSGSHDILASGEVFLFDSSDDFTIKAALDDESDVCVTLCLAQDSGEQHRIVPEVLEDRLRITCYNFGSAGTGLTRPVHIATKDNKAIYIIFWVYPSSDKSEEPTRIKYTLYCDQ